MTLSTTPEELENMVRRVVREEFVDLLRSPEALLEAWRREEASEARHDAILLREALEVLEADGDRPEAWMSWEEVEAELDRAEAAGELPD